MAIAAKISSTEIAAQVTNRFVDQYFEALLLNATGVTYQPGVTDDAVFLATEVPAGQGGYQRQVISYSNGDVSAYTDDGVGLTQKATIFAQDGTGTTIDFTHAALVWGSGNAVTLSAVTTAPTAGVDGTYTNIPIDSTSGNGVGLTVDLTISNSGASASDYAVTMVNSGYDYAPSDTLTILEGTLAGLGAVSAGAGPLAFSVATTNNTANSGNILAVAQTSSAVVLSAGNEAIFNWNLKQFGFYTP